jgi:hypothetical protein
MAAVGSLDITLVTTVVDNHFGYYIGGSGGILHWLTAGVFEPRVTVIVTITWFAVLDLLISVP